jgi:hypothetical protein
MHHNGRLLRRIAAQSYRDQIKKNQAKFAILELDLIWFLPVPVGSKWFQK